jgi:uncharacterized protein (DUF305 family)
MSSATSRTSKSQPAPVPGTPNNSILFWFILIAVLAALLAGALGYWLGFRAPQMPGASSIEAGFTRDMMVHHAQAVDMASYLYLHTDDPALRQLAIDIVLTQQAQVGQFQGWLAVWKLPLTSTTPAMSWMGMPTNGRMPGMATPEQLAQLKTLEGTGADILFLQLMIPHHRSAVEMAEYVLQTTQQSEVRSLAEKIVATQQAEIEYMQTLLVGKGAERVPDMDIIHMHEMATP